VLAGSDEPLAIGGVQERVVVSVLGWNESALWLPERRVLVCADVVGTVGQFLAGPDDPLGLHAILRLRPPRGALAVDPEAIAVGHGPPLTHDATGALRNALDTAYSGLPWAWARAARSTAGLVGRSLRR
jgi:hypothetical protein